MNGYDKDLEYYLEKSIITGLRAVFMDESVFKYSQDEVDSNVIITSAYPETDVDFKTPQIVFADTSFSLSQTSLSNNYESDIIEIGQDGVKRVVGKKYATIVPYSVSISCFAQEHGIAKDLANRVFNLIGFEAKDLFSDTFNLNIANVSKGGTGLQKNRPNNTYVSNISLTGNVHWIGEKRPIRPTYIKNIELLMKTAFDKKDYEEPYEASDYEKIATIKGTQK